MTIDRKVAEAARVLNLTNYLERRPGQLSGGQRQRVAIGRAIVRQPSAFLFDEPLSNLDAALRGTMRLEISELHNQLKTTMVYVTHDQVEAMTMADKIVVLNAGNIEQVGSPLELYKSPRQPLRRRLHRLAEDEPDRGAGRGQAGRQDDRRAPRASQRVDKSGEWKATVGVAEHLGVGYVPACAFGYGRAANGARRRRCHANITATRSISRPTRPKSIASDRTGRRSDETAGRQIGADHRRRARHRASLRRSLCTGGRDGRDRRHQPRRAPRRPPARSGRRPMP